MLHVVSMPIVFLFWITSLQTQSLILLVWQALCRLCMLHFYYFFLNLMLNRKYTTWETTFYIYEWPSTVLLNFWNYSDVLAEEKSNLFYTAIYLILEIMLLMIEAADAVSDKKLISRPGLEIIFWPTLVKLSGQIYFCSDKRWFWPDKYALQC